RSSSIIRRAATPEEVANMVVYVCSPQASAPTGAALRVDGGVVDTIAWPPRSAGAAFSRDPRVFRARMKATPQAVLGRPQPGALHEENRHRSRYAPHWLTLRASLRHALPQ